LGCNGKPPDENRDSERHHFGRLKLRQIEKK
jgi:hypothetical protein